MKYVHNWRRHDVEHSRCQDGFHPGKYIFWVSNSSFTERDNTRSGYRDGVGGRTCDSQKSVFGDETVSPLKATAWGGGVKCEAPSTQPRENSNTRDTY